MDSNSNDVCFASCCTVYFVDALPGYPYNKVGGYSQRVVANVKGDCMKVYCKKCKYYLYLSTWDDYQEYCHGVILKCKDSYRGKEKIYPKPKKQNKNNYCEFYELSEKPTLKVRGDTYVWFGGGVK
ncbi:MAG: hypothetical protein GY928_20690 [Colwellia sp.]|nr:hypothetical protein [Colwellia sp.]